MSASVSALNSESGETNWSCGEVFVADGPHHGETFLGGERAS